MAQGAQLGHDGLMVSDLDSRFQPPGSHVGLGRCSDFLGDSLIPKCFFPLWCLKLMVLLQSLQWVNV